MAINNFKPFATAVNANVTSQADWESLPALLSGFMAGKASSAQVNKAIRQASFIAAALAQYTANKSGQDVLDNGDLNGFITKMSAAFGKDFQALDATLTALAGLETGANKLPYFTGTDTASQTDFTSVGRDIIGKSNIADVLTYLGLGDVLHAGAGRLLAGTYVSSAVDATSIGVRAASGCQFMRAHKAPDAPDQSNYWQVIVLPETTESNGRISCLAMSGNDIHLGNGDASGISTWTILSGRQPASDTLTALSMLATGANQLPYFTGIGKVSQTPLTQMGRDIIGLTSVADALSYLGISSNLVPVGVPLPWPLAAPPSGWLLCNGQTFTTAQYPALAVAYPGLATPDLRGLFIRGLDNGRGYDPLRDLGTEQLDAFASHRHQPEQSGAGNRFVADYSENGSGSGAQITMGSNNYAMCRYTNYVGGTETRPRNFALNYIVRAA